MPYDPPNQSAWMEGQRRTVFPAFLVTSNVTSFHAYGVGSYCFFYNADAPGGPVPAVQVAPCLRVPGPPRGAVGGPAHGVPDGTGVIKYIINSTGGPTVGGSPTDPMTLPVNLVSYP